MALADLATAAPQRIDPAVAINAIPRSYNFAADLLERNLRAGRSNKPAYLDGR